LRPDYVARRPTGCSRAAQPHRFRLKFSSEWRSVAKGCKKLAACGSHRPHPLRRSATNSVIGGPTRSDAAAEEVRRFDEEGAAVAPQARLVKAGVRVEAVIVNVVVIADVETGARIRRP